MQDQAFLGPESGLAVPAEDGGVDLFVATQWLHADQRQICQALGLPPERVRLTLAGVGGAFGGREDLSMHVHACLLARHTGKPVKMVYSREESFFGHVHRHPATMRYEHGVSAGGRLVYVRAEVYFDGGAYASSTAAVVGNGGTMGFGPYVVPNVVDGLLRRLHQQPAVRGDARVRRGADGVRVRVADGPVRGGARPGSGRVPAAERHVRGIPGADGPDHRQPGAGRRTAPHRAGHAAAARRRLARGASRRPEGTAGRGVEHDARRGRPAWRRVRGRLQERRVLRGLRRLRHRAGAAGDRRRRAAGHRAHRGRRGGPGPGHGRGADRADRAGLRPRRRAPEGHRRRQRRLVLGVPADLRDRRRRPGRLRAGPRPGAGAGRAAAPAAPTRACGWPAAWCVAASGSRWPAWPPCWAAR